MGHPNLFGRRHWSAPRPHVGVDGPRRHRCARM